MLAILWPLVSWIFRGVVVKFVILSGLFAVMTLLIPKAIAFISPHIGVSSLSSAFGGMDSGIWWFLDFFALDYGLPLMIAAAVARFLIRRLPFIG
jgi:Protein of unknown function (DUF2523)